MNNFREMSFVRSLLVALVVLFVLGAGVPGGALARVEIANGHEGDPDDGFDVVSGGSGSSDGNDSEQGGTSLCSQLPPFDFIYINWIIRNDGTVVPVFSFVFSENKSSEFSFGKGFVGSIRGLK